MATTKRALKHKKSHRNKREHVRDSSEDSDSSIPVKPLTSAQMELFSKYIVPYRGPPNEYDKWIEDISERAVNAFHEGKKDLFTEIILETKSLHTRDDAVRVAVEVGWMDVAERLLIWNTKMSYKYPEWSAPLSAAFMQLDNTCEVKEMRGRWLLMTAVISAVKKNRKDAFNFLAPIVGVDFDNYCGQDVIDHVYCSGMDLSRKKKWLHLIIKYIDRNSSRLLLENAIYYYAWYQLNEHLPYLMDCLLSTNMGPFSRVMAALSVAITNRHLKTAYCLIDEFKKASLPINMSAMEAAESIHNIDMALCLYRNGCHSFPLHLYGKRSARELHTFLSKHGHEGIYSSIVIE